VRPLRRGATAACAVLALAACAQLAPLGDRSGLVFELTGRFAVHTDKDAVSGRLAWRHAAAGDELLVTSALGQGLARLERDAGGARLVDAEGREHRAPDAESLAERVLGYRLPLAGLAHWVRGQPAEGPAEEKRDAAGRLTWLRQHGWTVEYLGWEESEARPTRLRLGYPGLELRLAIDAWR